MYRLLLYEGTFDENIEIKFQSMQQVLDFLSLLNLPLNPEIWVQVSYERREDTRYDETEPHG